jgi:hypothetical protein
VSEFELRAELKRREEHRKSAADNPLRDRPSSLLFIELRAMQKGIYGDDDRKEILLAPQAVRANAAAVAAILPASALDSAGSGWRLNATVLSFGKRYNLCADEPFHEQPAVAECTAFLTRPSVVITAGHCVTEANLAAWRFVFGYQMNGANGPDTFPASAVYSGKRIVGCEWKSNGTDWAVVELDRPAAGVEPLRFDDQPFGRGTEVYVIGCPAGLPLKHAGGAQVRYFESGRPYFVANLDSYGGNSGAPVFTGRNRVAGILVRGGGDLSRHDDSGCARSLVCPDTGCRGEDAMRLALIPKELWR